MLHGKGQNISEDELLTTNKTEDISLSNLGHHTGNTLAGSQPGAPVDCFMIVSKRHPLPRALQRPSGSAAAASIAAYGIALLPVAGLESGTGGHSLIPHHPLPRTVRRPSGSTARNLDPCSVAKFLSYKRQYLETK